MKKVLVTANSFGKFSDAPTKLLQENGFEVTFNPYGRKMEEDEFIGAIADADAVILSTEQVSKRVIDSAKKLRIISRYGVGLDNIDLDYCKAKGLPVTITGSGNSNAVAEYAVTSMLAALKGLFYSANRAASGTWAKTTGLDLDGRCVGVIGLGSIGRRVVQKLSGFDVKILGYDIFYDDAFCSRYKVEKASLEEVFRQADVITFHIPSISDKPLLDAQAFRTLKDDVVIVNTARASLIDYEALYENLKSKKVFAAALDVHECEPRFNEKLMGLDNVILTPHNAALSKEAIDKTSMLAVENILKEFGLLQR